MNIQRRLTRLERVVRPIVEDPAEDGTLRRKIAEDIANMDKAGFGEWGRFMRKASKEEALLMFARLLKLKEYHRKNGLPQDYETVEKWAAGLFSAVDQD